MNKNKIRKHYINKRKDLSSNQIHLYSSEINEILLNNFINIGEVFHVFKHMKKFNEVNTDLIISSLLENNKRVVLPKMSGKSLISCEINKNQKYISNSFGVNEPYPCNIINVKEIDAVIVPLLICDSKGYRIGYGGGYYDRFLTDLNIIKIGINFYEPLDKLLPIENHDIPLDYLITPKNLIKF